MAITILVVAFILLAAFAAYCIITQSPQQTLKSVLQIGALAAFALLVPTSVIEWSSRWYLFAVLLIVWAILGVWALPGKQHEKADYKARRSIFHAITMLLLIFIALIPAFIFPQYKPLATTGAHQIASVNYTLTDLSRIEAFENTGAHRALNVEFWYPEDADGKYPLIVFSHGATGIKSSNESLYRELASHGYVVASIDHTYHALYTTAQDGHTIMIDRGYLQELMAEDAHTDRAQSYMYYQKWMDLRTDDISFVIDSILAKANQSDAQDVYALVDTESIGVMGHSLGGSAALGMGRIRNDIDAVIALESPFLTDIEGTVNGDFVWNDKTYPVPVLNVYGESWSHLGEWTQYAANNALLSATDATAFNVHIEGAGHLTLTDLALASPILTRLLSGHASTASSAYVLETINQVTLAFFNTYLKGEGSFTAAGTY